VTKFHVGKSGQLSVKPLFVYVLLDHVSHFNSVIKRGYILKNLYAWKATYEKRTNKKVYTYIVTTKVYQYIYREREHNIDGYE
jgi:hypothetical protein